MASAVDLRATDDKKLKAAIAEVAGPLPPDAERELIAIAFAHENPGMRKLARAKVDKHVTAGKALGSLLGRLRASDFEKAHATVRALDRDDRGQLAVAFARRGVNVHGVAFEYDADFAREYVHQLLVPKDKELYLTEKKPPPGTSSYMPEYVNFKTIPDVVFDELPKLRKKLAFDGITFWGSPITELPERFVEFAPFLKRLTLMYVDFKSIPEQVFACTKLEELSVCSFELASIGEGIKNLRALKTLSIHECKKLKALPAGLFELPELETLELGFAPLRTLPPEIAKLEKLRTLSLQSSSISKLPDEIAQLPIKTLIIRWSKVKLEDAKRLLPKAKIEV